MKSKWVDVMIVVHFEMGKYECYSNLVRYVQKARDFAMREAFKAIPGSVEALAHTETTTRTNPEDIYAARRFEYVFTTKVCDRVT